MLNGSGLVRGPGDLWPEGPFVTPCRAPCRRRAAQSRDSKQERAGALEAVSSQTDGGSPGRLRVEAWGWVSGKVGWTLTSRVKLRTKPPRVVSSGVRDTVTLGNELGDREIGASEE